MTDSMVVDAIEAERSRIAVELHDGIGQELTVSLLIAQQLSARIESLDPELGLNIRQLVSINERIAKQMRQLVWNLHPDPTHPGGVELAISNLSMTIDALSDFSSEFQTSGFDGSSLLDATNAIHLFRIAQEAANNALKHSGGSQINFELHAETDQILLRVTDNGVGFRFDGARPGHSGIANMKRHARLLGTSITFSTNPDSPSGTVVSCAVPRPAHTSERA